MNEPWTALDVILATAVLIVSAACSLIVAVLAAHFTVWLWVTLP